MLPPPPRLAFPDTGTPWPELERQLVELKKGDIDWQHGRAPAFIHYAGDDVLDVAKRAYSLYFSENGLGLRAFTSLAKMELEVVAMGLSLLHGIEAGRGAMTTGGTESIFLAVKAARDRHVAQNPGRSSKPKLVLAQSAHPAFSKAAYFMGLDTVRVPLRTDFTADPVAMAAAIDADTAMLVGSAPAYPHGVVDPIGELAAAASARGVWMHVDACVGGYLTPFAQMLGVPIEPWDFSVPGVTSISADLHKYGYAAKGASTLYFADEASYKGMSWGFDDWPRGQYWTNTLVGTRAGGAIAAAWAVMKYLGRDGYVEKTRRVLATREKLAKGVAGLGFEVLGDPRLAIIAFGSSVHDVAAVGAGMTARGWMTGYTKDPAAIHLMLNLTHEPVIGDYLNDLAGSVEAAKGAAPGGAAVAVY